MILDIFNFLCSLSNFFIELCIYSIEVTSAALGEIFS